MVERLREERAKQSKQTVTAKSADEKVKAMSDADLLKAYRGPDIKLSRAAAVERQRRRGK